MKTLCCILLGFGLVLLADGGKISGLITGKSAFTDSKDLTPGTFRKITATICLDLLRPPRPGTRSWRVVRLMHCPRLPRGKG